MALGGVAVELLRGEAAGEGGSILDAEVHAAPADRRVHMRGVAAEEDAAGLIGGRLAHRDVKGIAAQPAGDAVVAGNPRQGVRRIGDGAKASRPEGDRKSTRLKSST